MKWFPFNVFSKKATDWHRALVQVFGLIPQWNRRDYKSFSEEGYNANVWVYRCIQAVAQGAASVPWLLYQKRGKDMKELDNHALLDLLDNPNEFQGKHEFFEAMVAYLLIAGDSYIDMNGPDNGPPQELWTMRPDRLSIVPDAQNFVGYYQYNAISMIVNIPKERVVHIKHFNPLDDFYGLSPLQVAARGIDNDNAANAWNNALLNNGARPTGAMVTDSFLNETQYNQVKNEIDTQYKGSKNAGKPMLLEGGLKWQEMGITPKDMDFINSKKLSRVEICAAFGVPPEIVGDKEHATYSNYQEARKALYEDAIIPMLDRVRDKLNATLVKKFGNDIYLDYDKDCIEALQENADSKAARITKEYQGGLLMLNEAREALGHEALASGDIYIIPGNVWVVDAAGKLIRGPLQGQQKGPLGEDNPPQDGQDKNNDFFFNVKAFDLETDEQKTMFWKSMESARETFYKSVTEKIQKQFEAERQEVLKAYESGGTEKAIETIDNQIKAWQKLLTGIYVDVMQTFGDEMFNQLKNDANNLEVKIPITRVFNVFDKLVQKFIASTVAQKVVQVTDVTKAKISNLIGLGENEGESIQQIAKRIDSLYLDEIIPNRSTVIARTEVIGASNAGNSYAADQTGLNLEKEWISTRDSRTRDENDLFDHVSMDGVRVPKSDPYVVPGKKGDDSIMFPGDPKGQAGNVIQCRCAESYKRIK